MLLDFSKIGQRDVQGRNGEAVTITAKMYISELGKIISASIHAGGSSGLHRHDTSDNINYVLSGTGKAICDGNEEILHAGTCHICRKGSEHSIVNTGGKDLILLTAVVER